MDYDEKFIVEALMIVLADTHVHLYPQFDLTRTLTNAVSNLEAAFFGNSPRTATENHASEKHVAVLYLTERRGAGLFSKFPLFFETNVPGIELLAESPGAYHLRIARKHEVFLIAGHQVVTAEGLEVLGLCVEPQLPDGLTISEAITAVNSHGGVAVIPWSPGKWIGKRGRILNSMLESSDASALLLGDIYMRPRWFPRPSEFKAWEKRGGRVVLGSDPLPLDGEEEIVGRCGNWSSSEFCANTPLASAKAFLQTTMLNRLGRRSSLGESIRRQFSLRLAKRRGDF